MKFVSYNIQYGIGMDGRFDPERIAQSMAGADVIALQEVTRGFHKNGHADLVSTFADLFPDHFHAFGAPCDILVDASTENGRRVERRLQFGNMILSRWPILATRHFLLPRSCTLDELNLQRGALETLIATPTGPLRVYSVHLDHVSRDERISQIRFIKERLLNFCQEGGAVTGGLNDGFVTANPPLTDDFLILGDFNMEPESPEYLAMAGLPDASYGRVLRLDEPVDALACLGRLTPGCYSWAIPPGATRARGPERAHLDYGFVNAGLAHRLREARVDLAALGSDHFPVWIEID